MCKGGGGKVTEQKCNVGVFSMLQWLSSSMTAFLRVARTSVTGSSWVQMAVSVIILMLDCSHNECVKNAGQQRTHMSGYLRVAANLTEQVVTWPPRC